MSLWLASLVSPLVLESAFLIFALGPPSRARVFRPAYRRVPLANLLEEPEGAQRPIIRLAALIAVALSALVGMAPVMVALEFGLLLCFPGEP